MYDQLIAEARKATVSFATSVDCRAGVVGAALLADDGRVYSGCSIDCSCGIGFCAEHAAIAEMLKHRTWRIRAIVASNEGGRILPPCGRCRELMFQVDHANLDRCADRRGPRGEAARVAAVPVAAPSGAEMNA